MGRIDFKAEIPIPANCPFCRTFGTVVILPFARSLAPRRGWQVSCCECLCRGPARESEEAAIVAWNSLMAGKESL